MNNSRANNSRLSSRITAPAPVILGAIIASLQSIAVLAFGVFLVIRTLTHAANDSMVSNSGAAQYVGVGTAIFLLICFGFVIAGAWAMVFGKRWGRGAVVLAEFILGAMSFQMFNGGSVALGVITLLSAGLTLYLLMANPASTQWAEQNF